MMTPKIDFAYWIARIPDHVGELPVESSRPFAHYTRGANDAWKVLGAFERTAKRAKVYKAPYERHLVRLRSMVLLALIQAFERFLKELAAVSVDELASIILDDRLSVLAVHPRAVAAHFEERTLGKALCEGETWLDSEVINKRFGKLLADPFKEPSFKLFPVDKKDPDFWRRSTMDILWQLRHSIVHNVGVLTRSDAAKLRLLRRAAVAAPKVLHLSNSDVWHSKLFLDDLAQWSNKRVAARLSELLTGLHADHPSLFDPGERADRLAKTVGVAITVAGVAGVP